MQRDVCQYLFPYEFIPKGSKVLIYGAGELGQAYYAQIKTTGYCVIVGFVDRNYLDYKNIGVSVFSPDSISNIDFDYIVLAFRAGDFAMDVTRNLIRNGIDKNKIVYVGIRPESVDDTHNTIEQGDEDLKYAYKKEGVISVAMRYGSGLGDAIIQKGFFTELSRLSSRVLVDIYCPKAKEYLNSFYSDCSSYNVGVNDGGGLYVGNSRNYDLALSVVSIVRVDHVNESILREYPDFYEVIMRLCKKMEEYKLEVLPFRNFGTHIRRMQFLKKNCYTSFNYTDDFHVKRESIFIPIDMDKQNAFNELSFGDYITINYGTGMSTSGNRDTISKQWPFSYYEKFVELFKKAHPKVEIVQLGDSSADRVSGADRYIFGADMELVKYILLNTLLHIDCEGGLVHLASQLGTKCIVLFGPTQVDYFGYPNNINIISDKCHGCYGLYDTAYKCARSLNEPECMYSITPETVMKHTDAYLHSLTDNDVLIEK